MNLTTVQRETIDQVVACFETGKPLTDASYSTVALLNDGAGISFGAHQATARAGSLAAVVREYYARGGALGGLSLHDALERVERSVGLSPARLHTRPDVAALMEALGSAGAEPAMREAQRVVFDRLYWAPAYAQAVGLALVEPLSMLALYDLAIHSGPGRLDKLRPLFPEVPPSRGGAERAWATALVRARHAWLTGSSSGVVRATTYRTAEWLRLAAEGRWDLARPLAVRGVAIR